MYFHFCQLFIYTCLFFRRSSEKNSFSASCWWTACRHVLAAILFPVPAGHVAEAATWLLVTLGLGQPSPLSPSETFYFLNSFPPTCEVYVLPSAC